MKSRHRKKLQLPPIRKRISLTLDTCKPVFRETTLQIAASRLIQQLNPRLRLSPESLSPMHEFTRKQSLASRYSKSPSPKRSVVQQRQQSITPGLVPVVSKIVFPQASIAVEYDPQIMRCPGQTTFGYRARSQLRGATLDAVQETGSRASCLLRRLSEVPKYKVVLPSPRLSDLSGVDSLGSERGGRQVVYQKDQTKKLHFLSPVSSTSSLANEIKPKMY